MKKIILAIMLFVGVWWVGSAAHHAYADCQETSPGVWLCDNAPNDTNGVDLGSGADAVTIADGATVSNTGAAAIMSNGNVTVDSNNSGSISTTGSVALGIFANGNVNYTGNGSISTMGADSYGIFANGDLNYSGNGSLSTTGANAHGIVAAGDVDYSGNGSLSTSGNFAVGIAAGGDLNYSGNGSLSVTGAGGRGVNVSGNVTVNGGTIASASSTAILGFASNQTIIITGGTITGGNGTAIDARAGNDTVSLTVSSVTLTGNIDGNTGAADTLELNGTTDDQAGWDFFQNCMTTPAACSGAGPFTVNANGKSFTFTNFEAFINNMTVVIAAAGGQPISIAIGESAPAQTTSQPLCEGAVKIFRQPNGDLDVYSGFDALPPNGFMIGRITQGELAVNVLHYQDPGTAAQLGWFVEVTRMDKLVIQVFDGQGNPIGSCNL